MNIKIGSMEPFDARVIQVIETNLKLVGAGTKGNPFRRVKQYWTLDGELLAELDPQYTVTAMEEKNGTQKGD